MILGKLCKEALNQR